MLLIFHFAIDASVSLSINGSDFFMLFKTKQRP